MHHFWLPANLVWNNDVEIYKLHHYKLHELSQLLIDILKLVNYICSRKPAENPKWLTVSKINAPF
jgi:hypothetical protein